MNSDGATLPGIDRLLAKPITMTDLHEAITELFGDR
jgi:hypothetical protein